MTIRELFESIEGHEFSAEVRVASSWDLFIKLIRSSKVYKELLRELSQTPGLGDIVLSRIQLLSETKVDERFENPFDTAFSTYLLALSEIKPEIKELASFLVTKAQNLWWGSRTAEMLLKPVNYAGHFSNVISSVVIAHVRSDIMAFHLNAPVFDDSQYHQLIISDLEFITFPNNSQIIEPTTNSFIMQRNPKQGLNWSTTSANSGDKKIEESKYA